MGEQRWLDEREAHAWRSFLAMQARLRAHLARELMADSGLSDSDYAVLVNLSEAPGERLRPYELRDATQFEQSRLSHHLARMLGRGLVARAECPDDGRGSYVVLTDSGRAAVVAAAPRHVEQVRRAFIDALTPEQLDALAAASDAVLAKLDTTAA